MFGVLCSPGLQRTEATERSVKYPAVRRIEADSKESVTEQKL
jgi:hypothetical protein